MIIEFYEKPGCINNTKQKQLLESKGHTINAHSILTQKWSIPTLRPFFGNMPADKWFNKAAPRIKSGDVSPDNFNEQSAIQAMIDDPLLIRRPLIQIGDNCFCGFDHEIINSILDNLDITHLLTCPNLKNKCE